MKKATAFKRPAFGASFGDNDNAETDEAEHTVSDEEQRKFADNIMENLVINPFINFLQVLVGKGADLSAHVQKLKKFRDLDEKRREFRELEQKGKREEGVKKRDEVMRDYKIREEFKKKEEAAARKKKDQEKLKRKIAKEEEYDQRHGLMNCFHLIAKAPHPKVVDYLINATGKDTKSMLSHKDWRGRTPFNYLSTVNRLDGVFHKNFQNYIDQLINLKVDIDMPDEKNRSSLLNFYAD